MKKMFFCILVFISFSNIALSDTGACQADEFSCVAATAEDSVLNEIKNSCEENNAKWLSDCAAGGLKCQLDQPQVSIKFHFYQLPEDEVKMACSAIGGTYLGL